MVDISKIKLVIWDLDETFWNGTISEEKITIPQKNIDLINTLTDCGIINSICSKNEKEKVLRELDQHNLVELFVFMSIDWSPKGMRIKQQIEDMQLRPENVLFIDDNNGNLEEAKFYNNDMMIATPDIIDELIEHFDSSEKKDFQRKRLKQYRVLEEKHEQKSKFTSNEEFLYDSNIKISIKTDCVEQLERIHDLLIRSNQLNFTKIRSTKEELESLFSNEDSTCGYVHVSDKFGDYGIVGFYALKNNKLVHFTFSCRTLGMGIEQFVYNYLNRPELTIVGEVTSDLSDKEAPKWITICDNHIASNKNIDINTSKQVLIKGPCDLFQILPYIANREIIETDFTRTKDNGIVVESTGHTTHIVNSLLLSESQKEILTQELDFVDEKLFNNAIFSDYKIIVISILADANLGVYRRKQTGEKIAFLEGYHPLTDKNNWQAYINGEYSSSNKKITQEWLEFFYENYEFVGINTPEQIVDNLLFIRNNLPKDCEMVVMLGGELYYEKNPHPAYNDRHIVHKKINDAIKKIANENNIKLIDVNKYLVDQSSFYDHFNHYIKPVYYSLAGDIINIINSKINSNIKKSSKLKMVFIRFKEMLAPIYYKLTGRR